MSAPAACAWSVTSQADWITVENGTNRTGDGSVSLTVAAFDGTAERSAAVIIAKQTFTLTQSGCDIRLSTAELAFDGEGGSADLEIEAQDGCRWAIEGSASWVTFDPVSGTGTATSRVRTGRNQSTTSRDVEVRVGPRPLTLRQKGMVENPPPVPPTPLTCVYRVDPVEAFIASRGGGGVVAVSTANHCAWAANIAVPWARIRRGVNGTGSGQIEYELEANPDTYVVDFRKGAIEVRWAAPTAGQNVWLSQFGDCQAVMLNGLGPRAVRINSLSFGPDGGEQQVSVLVESPIRCPWRVDRSASWVTLPAYAQGVLRGDANFLLTVQPNTSSLARSTVLVVAERNLTITQAGR